MTFKDAFKVLPLTLFFFFLRFQAIRPGETSIPKSTMGSYMDKHPGFRDFLGFMGPLHLQNTRGQEGTGCVIPERHHSKHAASNDHKPAEPTWAQEYAIL